MVTGVLRHLAGMAAAWLVFVAEAMVGYLGLLAYALVTGSEVGGPLAGPMLVVIAAVLGGALVPLLFLPAVVVAEARGRRRGTAGVVGPAVFVAVVLAAAYAVGAAAVTQVSAGHLPLVAAVAALLVVAPVVLYALTARGLGWVAQWVSRHRSGSVDVWSPTVS
ncbi:hypothetical protein O7634_31220 [Micromonospora sp. WMMD1120]|uniref:hypothetical protein n=1 Tax=Micromonospora sp. WMMD1120 TaxID=3016106 RepID=UPI0024166C5B|nr:hypothetical protein [Micromonospora sp. WMMD1120]MDG4811247.1 hypothetical protein [Micromonospora sp. WMMD1120]